MYVGGLCVCVSVSVSVCGCVSLSRCLFPFPPCGVREILVAWTVARAQPLYSPRQPPTDSIMQSSKVVVLVGGLTVNDGEGRQAETGWMTGWMDGWMGLRVTWTASMAQRERDSRFTTTLVAFTIRAGRTRSEEDHFQTMQRPRLRHTERPREV